MPTPISFKSIETRFSATANFIFLNIPRSTQTGDSDHCQLHLDYIPLSQRIVRVDHTKAAVLLILITSIQTSQSSINIQSCLSYEMKLLSWIQEINPEFQTICISWQTVCMLWWILVKTHRWVCVRVAADCMHREGWWCQVENLSYVQLYQTCQNQGHMQSPPPPPPPAWSSTTSHPTLPHQVCPTLLLELQQKWDDTSDLLYLYYNRKMCWTMVCFFDNL